MLKKTIITAVVALAIGSANAAPQAYAPLATLQTPDQAKVTGDASYSFGHAPATTFGLHGLILGSALPARCSAMVSAVPTAPCSIPVAKDAPNLFIVTGLKASDDGITPMKDHVLPVGPYDRSALVVTGLGGTIVAIGQPVSSDETAVSNVSLELLLGFGSPFQASKTQASFDGGSFVVSIAAEPNAANLWLYEKAAFPVMTATYVAGADPIASLLRWRKEVIVAP